MTDWQSLIPKEDRDRLLATGFGRDIEPGARPALVVIDVTEAFLGTEPAGEPTATYPTACGPDGWTAVPVLDRLVKAARSADVPRVFTKGSWADAGQVGGAIKLTQDRAVAQRIHESGFSPALSPELDEYIVGKAKPSAFFGTPLLTYLVRQGVDTLILCGTTTSGCVRATAVDGFSYGYRVVVVADACFDRSPFSHASSLFDLQMKYANVVDSETAIAGLGHHAKH